MIDRTFLHLPKVGAHIERKLWAAGIAGWDDLWTALNGGRSAKECVYGRNQRALFGDGERVLDPLTVEWIDALDQSRKALSQGNFSFFLDKLKPSMHWRILPSVCENALYLDIETTGLSREHHYVTVIGALHRGTFHQWTWPQRTEALTELIRESSAIITFNGTRFDLPFLRRQLPAIDLCVPHIDLLHLARFGGFKGGQKNVEVSCGIDRHENLREFDGERAVYAWCSSIYGSRQDYNLLLKYNRADVEALPKIASCVYSKLASGLGVGSTLKLSQKRKLGHRPNSFGQLQSSWKDRMTSLATLAGLPSYDADKVPTVVGIDLRAKAERPTGWARVTHESVQTKVLFSDEEIVRETIAAFPDLVSIDAPLSLPRGRVSVSDDSPCRKNGGIVREAERVLWSRHIRVYPALIRQMQGLTARGIELARVFENAGIRVIESYPGAAQDVLNIPRKKDDQSLLEKGLRQFGFLFDGGLSHDELDAITSAMVGQFYLAEAYEAIGADDEGYMINPRAASMRWEGYYPCRKQIISLVGVPGSGKSTIGKQLALQLGWNYVNVGDQLRKLAKKDRILEESLSEGELAPEALVAEILEDVLASEVQNQLILDGYPRHADQLTSFANGEVDWKAVLLNLSTSEATRRLQNRMQCKKCGHSMSIRTAKKCPVCGAGDWLLRSDDIAETVARRLDLAKSQVQALASHIRFENLISVDAEQPVQKVVSAIIKSLAL